MMEAMVALIGLATALVGVWQQYVARQSAPASAVGGGSVAVGLSGAPPSALSPAARSKFVLGSVLRDAGMIFFVSLVLGFIVGAGNAESTMEDMLPVIVGLNFVCLLVGFTISATKAPDNRWKHLAFVAGATWLLGFVNVIFGVGDVGMWVASIIFIAICGVIAGGASYIFRKED